MGKQRFFRSLRALLKQRLQARALWPVNPDVMTLTSRLQTGAPPSCIQIKRCSRSAAVYLHVLTGDLPVTLRFTILEAPSRLELGGSFLWMSGADSLRTAREMTQVL